MRVLNHVCRCNTKRRASSSATTARPNRLDDIFADRAEQNDLAADRPEVIAEWRPMLDAWLESLPETPDPKCLSERRESWRLGQK